MALLVRRPSPRKGTDKTGQRFACISIRTGSAENLSLGVAAPNGKHRIILRYGGSRCMKSRLHPEQGRAEMLTIAEAQQRTELFLTGQMIEALQAVEYELPSFEAEPRVMHLSDAARSRVQIRHVRGASDATYLVNSFGDELLMQLQLNVHRLVVVYRVPALDALDANTLAVRLERWRLGAEHAGWKFGWRDAPVAGDPGRRYVETYCYAFAGRDFLEDEVQQLYWRTDIVQMTRYFMIEAARSGIRLSPRDAGFPL